MSTAFLQSLHENFWIEKSWQWCFQIMSIFKSIFSYIFQKRPVAVPTQITSVCNRSIIIFIQVIWFIDLKTLCGGFYLFFVTLALLCPWKYPWHKFLNLFYVIYFNKRKHIVFPVALENYNMDKGKLLLYTEDLYKSRWRERTNNWTLRIRGSDKWLKFMVLISM